MDRHLLIEGAAAIILVVVGGFFVIAAWRAYVRGIHRATAPATAAPFSRAELVPLIGVPLAGLALILLLIALAHAGGARPAEHHGTHGRAPVQLVMLLG